MRRFTICLLAINLLTFAWLTIGAKMELPLWEANFETAKNTIDGHKARDVEEEILLKVLEAQVGNAEVTARRAIEEYERSDTALFILWFVNSVGLTILALKKNTAQQADAPDRDNAPGAIRASGARPDGL